MSESRVHVFRYARVEVCAFSFAFSRKRAQNTRNKTMMISNRKASLLRRNRQEKVEEESQDLPVVEVLTVLITMVQSADRDLAPVDHSLRFPLPVGHPLPPLPPSPRPPIPCLPLSFPHGSSLLIPFFGSPPRFLLPPLLPPPSSLPVPPSHVAQSMQAGQTTKGHDPPCRWK